MHDEMAAWDKPTELDDLGLRVDDLRYIRTLEKAIAAAGEGSAAAQRKCGCTAPAHRQTILAFAS